MAGYNEATQMGAELVAFLRHSVAGEVEIDDRAIGAVCQALAARGETLADVEGQIHMLYDIALAHFRYDDRKAEEARPQRGRRGHLSLVVNND